MLLVAAGAQAAEAVMLLVAATASIIDAAAGRSSQESNGVALIVLEFIVIVGLAWVAVGLARVRPWSRTPAAITQGLTGIMAIILLQAQRFDWGVIALLLALAGLAGLFTPASFRALIRPIPEAQPAKTGPAKTGKDKTPVNRRS
jgi:hypothetical protein